VHVADPNVKLASSVDWRSKGAVLPVRDQASCGSCWAFSTAAALEGQLAIHKNEKIPLSPQNLVDCSTQNDGCDGGDQVLAFKFIKSSGISSEADYPYVGVDQKCHKNVHKTVSTISGYKHLSANENALISALSSVGPISVSVDASVWSLYAGGLFDERDCGTDINHAVLAAGYTDEYILVKNSWGTDWGEEGYIRLARGHNICQINEDNSYPIL
uniref:Cathepsin L-like proteinase n=1 Tax=Diabrotica virgifera virgifera TaxID=50390 RepID=A0A6P7GU79_DIAVI